jgi:hypothetical protein
MSTHQPELLRRRARGLAVPVVVALMALGSIGMWTGIPLAWITIASWLSGAGYVIYVIALGGCIVSMAAWGWGLGRLNHVYLGLRGRLPDERSGAWRPGARQEATLLDVMIVVSAVIALVTFLVWYLGFADLPSGTPWPDETSGAGP